MLKKAFVIFCLFLVPCLAAKDVFRYPLNSKTKLLITEVEQILSANNVVRGTFKQTNQIKGIKKEFVSQGNFIFSRDGGLYWNTKTPFPNTIAFTNKGLVQIDKDEKTLISSQEQPFFSRFSKVFMAILSGNIKELEEFFDVFFVKQNNYWIIGLKAKDNVLKKVTKEITITGKQFIEEISIKEDAGNIIVMQFSDFNIDPNVLQNEELKFFEI